MASVIFLFCALPCLARTRVDLAKVPLPPAVIADLDGDSKVDVAVGTRSGNSTAGFLYRLDIDLSGSTRTSSFTFFDRHSMAIQVSTVDLDGDHDLDLVVTGQPFNGPIGVWINDGSGGFQKDESGQYGSSVWSRRDSLRTPAKPLGRDSIGTVTRRSVFHLPIRSDAQPSAQKSRGWAATTCVVAYSVDSAGLPSLRAPPVIL